MMWDWKKEIHTALAYRLRIAATMLLVLPEEEFLSSSCAFAAFTLFDASCPYLSLLSTPNSSTRGFSCSLYADKAVGPAEPGEFEERDFSIPWGASGI